MPVNSKEYITIDAVLDEYDAEKQPEETKDFLVMNYNSFSGIDISVLGAIESEEFNEVSGILSGEDFSEVSELEGLGQIASRERELRAIKNHLLRTRRIISERPYLVQDVEHPRSFLGMVDYALKYWNTDKRDDALGILSGEEDKMNELEGLRGKDEGYEDVELYYGMNGLGTFEALGRAKRQRKFFSKVKEAAKKAGQGIKKIAKALVRYNPLTASIRGAVLLALKVNLMKVASKFKWGYLTEEEARAKGFDMEQWRKLKKQLQTAENMFVKVLQGKAENFKKAMLTGRGGKLSGTGALGYVVAASTAGATATAIPFITKILNLLKKIDYKKLIANVSSLVKSKKAKAEEKEEVTQEGESALPEGGQTSEGDPSVDVTKDAPAEDETTSGNNDTKEATQPEGETPPPDETSVQSSTPSTPATKQVTPASEGGEPSIITKAVDWVKENKTTSVLIAGGALFLLYQAFKPKHSLSGAKRGKKKKGKAKTHPPKPISGKKHKGKGKGKQIKL